MEAVASADNRQGSIESRRNRADTEVVYDGGADARTILTCYSQPRRQLTRQIGELRCAFPRPVCAISRRIAGDLVSPAEDFYPAATTVLRLVRTEWSWNGLDDFCF